MATLTCQETWKQGKKHDLEGWRPSGQNWKFVRPFLPVVIKRNPVDKKSFNCSANEEGKFVLVTLPENDQRKVYLNSIPIWNNLKSLPDGLYTWIFYKQTANLPMTFAATKTWSKLEMATQHLAIASKVRATTVHGAGELRKSGDTYTYNLLSGKFMQEWKAELEGACTPEKLELYVDSKFKEQFRDHKLIKVNETLIDPNSPITAEEIAHYTNAGWTFKIFATKEECIAAMKTKAGRRRTRRGGNPKEILRGKQIRKIQTARRERIDALIEKIAYNPGRRHWEGPSQAKLEHLSELVVEHNRLLAMGKGGATRRTL